MADGVDGGLDGGLLEEEGHDVGVILAAAHMSGVHPYWSKAAGLAPAPTSASTTDSESRSRPGGAPSTHTP